jgi:hypothetical protein
MPHSRIDAYWLNNNYTYLCCDATGGGDYLLCNFLDCGDDPPVLRWHDMVFSGDLDEPVGPANSEIAFPSLTAMIERSKLIE